MTMRPGLNIGRNDSFVATEPIDANHPESHRDRVQVMVIDDDLLVLRMLSLQLQHAGYKALYADNGETALKLVSNETAVALLDLRMPGISGMECLRYIRLKAPDTQVIVLTGSDDVQDAVNAMREGAFEYLRKPCLPDEILSSVGKGVDAWRLRRENAGLRESHGITVPASLQQSPTFGNEKLTQDLNRIAMVDSTVLIGGESGTGKSTVARLIHQKGPRAQGPFVSVNCAALPRDLIESELFGHSKGAFTGAVKDRPGRVESAHGGTLFLDEVGDLPLELQPKLLTFLQERTVQRVGCNEVRSVNVRMIVATHRDLAAMCQSNLFRQDLYYRLNVLRISMPPLRDRIEEIPMFVANILRRISARQNVPCPKIADDAIHALKKSSWPGNIRELENVLERAAAFCQYSKITANDLSFDAVLPSLDREAAESPANRPRQNHQSLGRSAISLNSPELPSSVIAPTASRSLVLIESTTSLAGKTMDEIEHIALLQTLEACNGNKAKAARMLGLSEKSIYNKIKRFGVSTPINREGNPL